MRQEFTSFTLNLSALYGKRVKYAIFKQLLVRVCSTECEMPLASTALQFFCIGHHNFARDSALLKALPRHRVLWISRALSWYFLVRTACPRTA